MAKRDNRVVTYLTDDEYAQLKEWSDAADKPLSQLLRQAILEYTDKDRLRRVEEKVDRVLELSQNGTRTHTLSTNSVPEKARAVAEHIYDNYEMPVKHTDVEIAVENIAGVGDERSLKKYFSQLKKRGLLYQHPSGNVWTDSKTQYVGWVEGAYHDPDVLDVTGEYGMGTDEYIEIAEEIEQ